MQGAGGVLRVCSVGDILRKGAAECGSAYGSEWALGRRGHIAGTAVGLRTVTGEKEMEDVGFNI